jgi:hypothetical protein
MVIIFKGRENGGKLNFCMIDGWITLVLVLLATRRRTVGGRIDIPVGMVGGSPLLLWKRGFTGCEGTFFTTGRDAAVGVGR